MTHMYPGVSSKLLMFTEFCRHHGMKVGVQESLDALKIAETDLLTNKKYFYFSLRSLYSLTYEDTLLFDGLFNKFWIHETSPERNKTEVKGQMKIRKKKSSAVMLGKGDSSTELEEAKNVTGANSKESLRNTDFSHVLDIQKNDLERIAEQLWREMSLRLMRRMKKKSPKGQVDLRKTIRESISNGGNPIQLKKVNKKKDQYKLILMLDVSGSMDKYSFFLLRFICTLKAYFKKIEAFIFSTKLMYISDFLKIDELSDNLNLLSKEANHWSSGTKIGYCLRQFNEQYGKRMLNGRSMFIVLSDGLDTGEPNDIAVELAKIKGKTKKIIWLNPLKGQKGYQPLQSGIVQALPHVDALEAAHNLDSLLSLEKYFENV